MSKRSTFSWLAASTLVLPLALAPAFASAELYITVIQGLGGQAEYQELFDEQRERITAASITMTDEDKVTTFNSEDSRREGLLAHFIELGQSMSAEDRAAIYLIGHGSFDGDQYKFNIPGPDISGADLKTVLEQLPGQNHFLVNTSSTSGAMLETILGDGDEGVPSDYILISATRNGNERNATHFGGFFADALTSDEADLNKNNNVSIQEAFDFAERSVADYFESGGRLATEHPQIRGEGAAQFSLARVSEVQFESDTEQTADLLQERLDLDARIEEIQLRRGDFSNSEYIERLRNLILESAALSEQIDRQRLENAGENLGGNE